MVIIKAYIDNIVNEYEEKDFFKGANILVSLDNKTILEKSYGYARWSPYRSRLEIDTIFDIASLTKIFTSTAILRLISEGELALSDKFSRVFEFKNINVKNSISDVTIEELLNHSSGLTPWYPFYTMKDKGFEDILEHINRKYPLKKGTVQYSDINFILLGKLIERIMGKKLDASLKELVFDALDLHDTAFAPLNENIAATEYGNRIEFGMIQDRGLSFKGFRDESKPIVGQPNDGNCYYYFQGISGHAGIFSNLRDLNRLCSLYQNKGNYNGKTIFKEDIINKSFIDYGGERGLGWQISSLYPSGLGHTGFTGTSLYLNIEKGLNIIILTNRLHVDKPVNINEFRLAIHSKVISSLDNN